MSFTAITKRAVGKCIPKAWLDLFIDNLSDLDSRVELNRVFNQSFELDSDDDGEPNNYTVSTAGAASYQLTRTQSFVHHGRQSILCTTTAGASDSITIQSDDYIPCGPGERLECFFRLYPNVATINIKFEFLWYYWNGSAWAAASTSATTIYENSATNPTAWAARSFNTVVPAGANFAEAYRLKITIGGNSVSANVALDGIDIKRYVGYVPVSVEHADQPLDTQTQGAAENTYTVTPYTAMSNAVGNEWPHMVRVRIKESAAGMVKWIGSGSTYVVSKNYDGIGQALQDYDVPLTIDGQFSYRTDAVAGTVTLYLIGYYV